MSQLHGTWTPAYIAIGSNQDRPFARVRAAFDQLHRVDGVRVVIRSNIYRSPPLGSIEQPDFCNAVAGALTTLAPLDLLSALKQLEAELGRATPVVRWGPRIIDFDLSVYGNVQMHTEQLQLPHPGAAVRAFVLKPLGEIAPSLMIPGAGRVETLLSRVDSSGLVKIETETEC